MDLSEYYVIYNRDVDHHLGSLRDCIQQLQDTPGERSLVEAAARAAHGIKGASWTMRDTPMLLNNEPPDARYDEIALSAEHLETHLEAVRQGQRPLDAALLRDGLTDLEAAIMKQRSQT